ncbi:MAG TPA: ABC transporter substrate-binding protein [Mycobacteriales bacterium]|jgi:osmoprotectant transport system substrate-binding protein|nr:ABC transporter substrate-binding protein [Mycobacteriales bacterium]
MRVLVTAAATASVLLGVAGCGGTASENSGGVDRNKGSKGSLTIADAGFTESQVMANMFADVLTKAGYKTKETSVKSTEISQGDLEKGGIAVIPAYVATYADELNVEINGPKAASVASPDLDKAYAALKTLAAKKGLTPLKPGKAVDQNAFAVSKKFAAQYKLETLSDLGKLGKPLKLAAGPECKTRPFCVPGLKSVYGINITSIDPLGVDTAQSKQAVAKGADQLALVLTTDATVDSAGLKTLKDDKKLQNADYLVPIVNTKKLTPDIEKALNKLTSTLTTEDLAQLNQKVDQGQQKPGVVASDYLKSKNLI